ncbi:MAG: thioesterase domain-containing protein, partial [Myxococcota bacterium]
SIGGVLAFELARQLEALDQEVAQLVVIDAWLPGSVSTEQIPDEDAWHAVAQDFADAGSVLEPAEIARRLHVGAALGAGWQAYELPGPIQAPILLLRATRPRGFANITDASVQALMASSRDYGWGPLSRAGTRVQEIPGDHFTMMAQEGLGDLAEAIRAAVSEAIS